MKEETKSNKAQDKSTRSRSPTHGDVTAQRQGTAGQPLGHHPPTRPTVHARKAVTDVYTNRIRPPRRNPCSIRLDDDMSARKPPVKLDRRRPPVPKVVDVSPRKSRHHDCLIPKELLPPLQRTIPPFRSCHRKNDGVRHINPSPRRSGGDQRSHCHSSTVDASPAGRTIPHCRKLPGIVTPAKKDDGASGIMPPEPDPPAVSGVTTLNLELTPMATKMTILNRRDNLSARSMINLTSPSDLCAKHSCRSQSARVAQSSAYPIVTFGKGMKNGDGTEEAGFESISKEVNCAEVMKRGVTGEAGVADRSEDADVGVDDAKLRTNDETEEAAVEYLSEDACHVDTVGIASNPCISKIIGGKSPYTTLEDLANRNVAMLSSSARRPPAINYFEILSSVPVPVRAVSKWGISSIEDEDSLIQLSSSGGARMENATGESTTQNSYSMSETGTSIDDSLSEDPKHLSMEIEGEPAKSSAIRKSPERAISDSDTREEETGEKSASIPSSYNESLTELPENIVDDGSRQPPLDIAESSEISSFEDDSLNDAPRSSGDKTRINAREERESSVHGAPVTKLGYDENNHTESNEISSNENDSLNESPPSFREKTQSTAQEERESPEQVAVTSAGYDDNSDSKQTGDDSVELMNTTINTGVAVDSEPDQTQTCREEENSFHSLSSKDSNSSRLEAYFREATDRGTSEKRETVVSDNQTILYTSTTTFHDTVDESRSAGDFQSLTSGSVPENRSKSEPFNVDISSKDPLVGDMSPRSSLTRNKVAFVHLTELGGIDMGGVREPSVIGDMADSLGFAIDEKPETIVRDDTAGVNPDVQSEDFMRRERIVHDASDYRDNCDIEGRVVIDTNIPVDITEGDAVNLEGIRPDDASPDEDTSVSTDTSSSSSSSQSSSESSDQENESHYSSEDESLQENTTKVNAVNNIVVNEERSVDRKETFLQADEDTRVWTYSNRTTSAIQCSCTDETSQCVTPPLHTEDDGAESETRGDIIGPEETSLPGRIGVASGTPVVQEEENSTRLSMITEEPTESGTGVVVGPDGTTALGPQWNCLADRLVQHGTPFCEYLDRFNRGDEGGIDKTEISVRSLSAEAFDRAYENVCQARAIGNLITRKAEAIMKRLYVNMDNAARLGEMTDELYKTFLSSEEAQILEEETEGFTVGLSQIFMTLHRIWEAEDAYISQCEDTVDNISEKGESSTIRDQTGDDVSDTEENISP